VIYSFVNTATFRHADDSDPIAHVLHKYYQSFILAFIMSTATGPELPPEITDAIIDQVSELNVTIKYRKELLGVCSLVSKSWLPRSRHYLFVGVVIDRMRPFLGLLASPLCTIRPFVQVLQLEEESKGDELYRLSALPALQHFSISYGKFTSTRVFATFQNLKILGLYQCHFGSLARLLEALSLCPSLRRIILFELKIGHCVVCDAFNFPPPPSLVSIVIRGTGRNSDILEWLLPKDRLPVIESVELLLVREDESLAIAKFLRALGPSLKHLELGFLDSMGSYSSSQGASLTSVLLKYLNYLCPQKHFCATWT
jgi:hypothetical protein